MPRQTSPSHGLRLERVAACPRYDGRVFRNSAPVSAGLKKGTTMPTISEFLCGGQRRTPPGPLPVTSPLDAWARPVETGLRTTWLGHSTVLIEIDGARVLTDPVWGDRVSPVSFAGPKRFHPVPAPISALPPLDAVVISHDHFDHLDRPSILALGRLEVPFVTSLGVGARLEGWGIPAERIVELDWWESHTLSTGTVITAAPSQHFSGRSLSDRNKTAWSSIHVRGARHGVFFSGDTGLTPEYADVRARLGPIDLIMLEVGAFHPAWGDIHLGPENALAAQALLGGAPLLPVHWGTFNLAIHAWDEPAETLTRLADASGARLVMPRLGQCIEPSRFERVDPWWREVVARKGVPAPVDEKEEAEPADGAGTSVPWPLD